MSDTNLALFMGDKSGQMPAHIAAQPAALGNENLDAKDFAIPTIKVLQGLSPECEEVAGAKPGKLFNTITKELFDKLYVINLKYDREYTIFKKRTLGGGFHGTYPSLDAANAHASTLPGAIADYEITETAKHVVLVLNEKGEAQYPAVMYFSSSALEQSRVWNSSIQLCGKDSPRFARVWELGVLKRENAKGKWFVPNTTDMGWAPEGLYKIAKEHYDRFSSEKKEPAAA